MIIPCTYRGLCAVFLERVGKGFTFVTDMTTGRAAGTA